MADVATSQLGKMLDKAKNRGALRPYLRNPDVRWFDINTSNLQMMPFEDHEIDRYSVKAGDVVVCEGGEAGRAGIWSNPESTVMIQKALHRVRCGPRLHNRFLVHRLMYDYFDGALSEYYTGATIKHLTGQDLARYEFPLPPLGEQRKIASILDQADDLRRRRRLALEKLNALPQAIFQDMFGDPIANPKGWPTELLGSLCRLVRGSSPRPQGDARFFGGPIPRLMIADVTRDGMVVYPKIDSLTSEGARRSRPLAHGTVVMAVSGAVGLPAILGIDACIHDGFVGFPDLDERISPLYLYYWLQSQRRLNSSRAPGAIWTNLTTDQVSAFSIPIPPPRTQASFEQRVRSLSSIVTNMTIYSRTLADLFSSLQHYAFAGTLDPLSTAATLTSLQRATHATPLAV